MTRFNASMEEYPSMLSWLLGHLTSSQLEETASLKMQLAFEEAVVNVIHHAYRDRGGVIELRFQKEAAQIVLSILDEGPAFNPLQRPEPVLTDPLEERALGGLGVFFMKECVDEVTYARKGQHNVLTLIKRLSQKR
jgi:serine/threonine-protein kinase RsbW